LRKHIDSRHRVRGRTTYSIHQFALTAGVEGSALHLGKNKVKTRKVREENENKRTPKKEKTEKEDKQYGYRSVSVIYLSPLVLQVMRWNPRNNLSTVSADFPCSVLAAEQWKFYCQPEKKSKKKCRKENMMCD
jgi:hypothetical protein